MKEILTVARGRFQNIDALLSQENINKHDQSHQIRTAVHAVRAMRQMGFEHREMMVAGAGALIHDIAYNQPDDNVEDSDDGYNVGKKARHKEHAKKGAHEAGRILRTALGAVREQGDSNPALKELISYKDANGEMRVINEQDIELIEESILNHNDYGKDEAAYDPRLISKSALMVQMFDKLDICRKRVYDEHMTPGTFVEGSGEYDEHYFHKVVPYCIRNYEAKMDAESGTIEMTYHVEIGDFKKLMREKYPHFNYSEAEFSHDFLRAYTKNCRIAAEAAGVILDNSDNRGTLTVKLDFGNGRTEEMAFNRPNREIYEQQTGELRVSIAERLKNKTKDAA